MGKLTEQQINALTLDELRVECAKTQGWSDSPVSDIPWQMTPPGYNDSRFANCPDYPQAICRAFLLNLQAG